MGLARRVEFLLVDHLRFEVFAHRGALDDDLVAARLVFLSLAGNFLSHDFVPFGVAHSRALVHGHGRNNLGDVIFVFL